MIYSHTNDVIIVSPALVFFPCPVLLYRKGLNRGHLSGHLSNVAFALVNNVACVNMLRPLRIYSSKHPSGSQ